MVPKAIRVRKNKPSACRGGRGKTITIFQLGILRGVLVSVACRVCACTMDMLVSSALEADSSLPSFFEMFMTQQVEQSLKPAARHAHR